METSAHDKSVLRRKFKSLRRDIGANSATVQNLKLNLERFLRDYAQAQICLYQGKGHEAPCRLEPVDEFFYPVLKGEELEFRRPHSPEAFHLNALAISEPILEQSEALRPGLPTVICCPAVAMDRAGQRLGMGKGFYDRYFAQHPDVLRVGVVFHVQISALPLPAESWDQALDWIVSDKMILRTSTPTRSSQSWT